MSSRPLNPQHDTESGVNRRRSLVRPERQRLDETAANYHYVQVVNAEQDHLRVQSLAAGLDPTAEETSRSLDLYRLLLRGLRNLYQETPQYGNEDGIPLDNLNRYSNTLHFTTAGDDLRGGTAVYGLNDEVDNEEDTTVLHNEPYDPVHEPAVGGSGPPFPSDVFGGVSTPKRPVQLKTPPMYEKDDSLTLWQAYCWLVTFWAPNPLLRLFGIKGEAQFAWREKIALITVILMTGAVVAFLTFGFTRSVCTDQRPRIHTHDVTTGYLVMNGKALDLLRSTHPAAAGITSGTNVLYPPVNAGGRDATFLFQNVNGNCKGLITPRDNCSIPYDGEDVAWYMPCKTLERDAVNTVNFTWDYYSGYACHTSGTARNAYYSLQYVDVFYRWEDLKNSLERLVVYSGSVLNLDFLDWISTDDLEYPELFDRLRSDPHISGQDITLTLTTAKEKQAARCLQEIAKVGLIDLELLGCLALQVVLYILLVFILLVVVIRFLFACYFRWVIAPKQGAGEVLIKDMAAQQRRIEDWSGNINTQGPIQEVPEAVRATNKNNRRSMFKRGLRLSLGTGKELDAAAGYYKQTDLNFDSAYTTVATQRAARAKATQLQAGGAPSTVYGHTRARSLVYLDLYVNALQGDLIGTNRTLSILNPFDSNAYEVSEYGPGIVTGLLPELVHPDAVPQPPAEYEPFGYPLAHTICFVTAYLEDAAGMRTTLDSVVTTDYPNLHKMVMIVCDGLIKGSGNEQTTPEIVLGMMTDFVVPVDRVQPNLYVAVAQGSKRHNMAKVYAGFYAYDDSTVPVEKQQRVPVVCVVKCGTPAEAGTAKPGNRGKRDSQIILMLFLQRVMFDERMLQLEFEILQLMWRVTGLMADMYEIVLMVDADTKVYPDSLTHMVAEMVKNPGVMGLCGETKIANKAQLWVTAIQVFEYYVLHHLSKAFELTFGLVTCLPGCFCMYRIKAPKGKDGFWVPILANPDIVERYSDNDVLTLHRKNLLLLGEDRYLTSLMLKTFPKRKQVFVPKAACKTIVPDKFLVLLSQRRRWINLTVHNLMELMLVKDLCGTFCFLMQFVIGIELVGTLVLPVAICLTIYVVVVLIVLKPTPVLSLALLGVIFGLPAILIVVTVSHIVYLLWMLIYLLALPIWNFVLPTYAYWKFDDFSWGETRQVAGGAKDVHGADKGEFDHSSIVMKRWRDFERQRRTNEAPLMPAATWDPAAHPEA